MPQELLQDLFFDCVTSIVKSQRGHIYKPPQTGLKSPRDGKHTINDILSVTKQFEKMADKSKQEVLLNFIQNKAVLRSLYDMMLSERNMRATTTSLPARSAASQLDFNRLFLQHQRDGNLLSRMPGIQSVRRTNSQTKSATNLRSNRARDSQSIEPPLRSTELREDLDEEAQQYQQETLNVVVQTFNPPKREQVASKHMLPVREAAEAVTTEHSPTRWHQQRSSGTQLGAGHHSSNNELMTDRMVTQFPAAENDGASSQMQAPNTEVLIGSDKMSHEVSHFANKYEAGVNMPGPARDSPARMAYLASQSAIHEPVPPVSRNLARPSPAPAQGSSTIRRGSGDQNDLVNLNASPSEQNFAYAAQDRAVAQSFLEPSRRPPASSRVAPRLIINSSYANL